MRPWRERFEFGSRQVEGRTRVWPTRRNGAGSCPVRGERPSATVLPQVARPLRRCPGRDRPSRARSSRLTASARGVLAGHGPPHPPSRRDRSSRTSSARCRRHRRSHRRPASGRRRHHGRRAAGRASTAPTRGIPMATTSTAPLGSRGGAFRATSECPEGVLARTRRHAVLEPATRRAPRRTRPQEVPGRLADRGRARPVGHVVERDGAHRL